MHDKCTWKHCRNYPNIVYLGKAMCDEHWGKFCEMQDQDKEDQARKKIGLSPRPPKKLVQDDSKDVNNEPSAKTADEDRQDKEIETDETIIADTEESTPLFRRKRR